MRKKRGYKRETPIELVRDYKLFAIACEGGKREPSYFNYFKYLSRKIAVDVIEDVVQEEEAMAINSNKSAPKWVLDRAIRYIEKEGLSDEDDLWFVMDIDRWEYDQLKEIADYCENYPNWHIVLSNPCFEVWLYFHKKSNIEESQASNCGDFKHEISTFDKGGYHPLNFIPDLLTAIENSRLVDKTTEHFYPDFKTTKLYRLGESIVNVIPKNDFKNFCEKVIPKIKQTETELHKRTTRN